MSLLEDLRSIVAQLCPEPCPRCLEPSDSGFCAACRREFLRVDDPCTRCGLPGPCRRCPALEQAWPLAAIRAPFVYAPPLARFLRAHKYSGRRSLGRVLGQLLRLEIETSAADCDALIAVPLHVRRLRVRGFNQAEEIARPIARGLGLPLLSAPVRRERDTQALATLDRRRRMSSMQHAFSADGRLAGLKIAIVDDVITTGATVNALAHTLASAGAARVEAWAVLRTTGRDTAAAQPPLAPLNR